MPQTSPRKKPRSASARRTKPSSARQKKGRLSARRADRQLIDSEADWFELALLGRLGMYKEWGGAPSGGCRHRSSGGRSTFIVIANDATVKAGHSFR